MEKSKNFYKFQISMCGVSCFIDFIMILVSINLMLHTSSRASISIIAMLTWAAAGLLNGIMAVTYIREFKKKYKKENK
jgi:uncharacterized membrane protein YjfL (UPF0719 family)